MAAIPTTTHNLPSEWLTEMLLQSQALPEGEVIAVQQRDNAAFNSQISHLVLTYSADAPETAPRHLLLKLKKEHHGKEEVAFYQLAQTAHPSLSMLVCCYGADYSEETGNSYLLLEDVSSTHLPPVVHGQHLALNYVPTQQHLSGIVDAIARFHAHFWQHSRSQPEDVLFTVSDWYRTKAHYEEFVAERYQHWTHFIGMEGNWFPAEMRQLYERVLAGLSTLWEHFLEPRITTGKQLTLTNGDCYLGQFLCPKDPTRKATLMVDLDSACVDFGAMDLVYLFATFWTPAQRSEGGREEKALRQYYETLLVHGVKDYGWDELLQDYRLMLTLMLFHPVWDQTYQGSNNTYWWPKMQCLTSAYRDWQCEVLLP